MTAAHAGSGTDATTANAAIAFGAAGLLPVLPFIGSVVALVLGALALHNCDLDPSTRGRARVGITLGVIGVLAPAVALFIYCVLLGYPFPIHRYNGG